MIKDEYRTETNKDVYAENNGKRGLEEHSTGDYSSDYVKWLETKLKNNEVLDLVSKRFELKAKIKIIGNTSSHGFEIDEIVTAIDFEAKYNQWVCEGKSGKRWYVNEDEGTVC